MSRWLTVGLLILLAAVGFALSAFDSFTLRAIGFVLVGLAGVLAIALVFYVIGAGEDRERRGDDDGGGV